MDGSYRNVKAQTEQQSEGPISKAFIWLTALAGFVIIASATAWVVAKIWEAIL